MTRRAVGRCLDYKSHQTGCVRIAGPLLQYSPEAIVRECLVLVIRKHIALTSTKQGLATSGVIG